MLKSKTCSRASEAVFAGFDRIPDSESAREKLLAVNAKYTDQVQVVLSVFCPWYVQGVSKK